MTTLLDLPLEVLTGVCLQLDLLDLVRVAEASTRLRHGDGDLDTVELPTQSPVVTVLRELAFHRPELVPSVRPTGSSESWIAYLARCTRQRRCREAPPMAAESGRSRFVDFTGRLLKCGRGLAAGDGQTDVTCFDPTPMAISPMLHIRSVASGVGHSLVLSWDGRVYSFGAKW
jgi:hypothetical protein